MVADRVAFLDAGHYAGLTAALADAVLGDGAPRQRCWTSAAGTGHHLAGVLDRLPDAVGLVLDSSRYAARRAARAHPRAAGRGRRQLGAAAGPGRRRRPRAGRVRPAQRPRDRPRAAAGGRLVVVTPAADHLGEIVGPLGLLRVDPDKAARLAASLEPHLRPVRTTSLRRSSRSTAPPSRRSSGMGPHARHLPAGGWTRRWPRCPNRCGSPSSVDITTYPSSLTRRTPPVMSGGGYVSPPRVSRSGRSPSKLRP